MDETNIITMLLHTQRDCYDIIKSTQEIEDTISVTVDLEHKLFELWKINRK